MAGHGCRHQSRCAGIGMWEWACNDQDGEPDVVLAAAGDVPTLKCWRPSISCASYAGTENSLHQRGRP